MKIIKYLLVGGMLLCGCANDKEDSSIHTVTLNIKVEDKVNDQTLYDDDLTVEGNINSLADFLSEAKELNVEMEDSQYGTTINGIMDLTTEDWNKGPWWTFESETNKTCKEAGYCPAANEVEIENGDQFIFTYSDSY